jgi:hypothetical protein
VRASPAGGDEERRVISQSYAQHFLTETILAFKNTLDWMSADSDVLACATLVLPPGR